MKDHKSMRCAALGMAGILGISLIFGLAGCRKPQIQVYRTSKEPSSPSNPTETQPAFERIAWTLPNDWKEQAVSGMRQGSFLVSGKGGTTADCSIIQLSGNAGGHLANVNRWRNQLHLKPISEETLKRDMTQLQCNGQTFLFLDLTSDGPIGTPPQHTRMLIAILTRPSSTWFIKMTGEQKLVSSQKAAFIELLKSLRFSNMEPASSADQPPPSNSLRWKAPPQWKEQPATAMRKGSFLINGHGGLKADVSITSFSGAAGGLLANINRWRNQIELSPIAESDLLQQAERIQVHGVSVVMIDMVSLHPLGGNEQKTRILGAILPQQNETWFVKIMGDDPLVKEQRPLLLNFLRNIQFPSTEH